MKWKKVLKYGLPALIGTGVIIWLITKDKKKKALANSPLPEPVLMSPTTNTADRSMFPLKKGSRNSKVAELQRILGVSADGIFGSGTEGALKSFAGVSSVSSQVELDGLAAKKSQAQNQQASLSRAQLLLTQFKAGGKNIYVTESGWLYGYVADSFGAINYNSKDRSLPKGLTLANADWKIIGSTKGGNLQIECVTGDMKGTYVVNPNIITLV